MFTAFFRKITRVHVLLVLILLITAAVRFYRIGEYITFLGDEGRDMLVVKRMIVDHKPTLLGPITSVGSMYMGPVYYYFMVPFLWAWNLNPVGPSVMVVIFSIATVFLIYKTSQEFFSHGSAYIAAFLYAVSPLAIIYGRSSWNPNIVPFFAILIIYSLLKTLVKKNHRWLYVAGFALGIIIQLHYVTMLFIPVIAACLFLFRPKFPKRIYVYFVIAFLISYSPFLLFELRHSFVNITTAIRFITTQNRGGANVFLGAYNIVTDVSVRLFWRLIFISSAEITKVFLVIMAVFLYRKVRKSPDGEIPAGALKVLLVWLIAGLLSFGLYRGVVYDYYLGSLFPLPFMLTGYVLSAVGSGKRLFPGTIITVSVFVYLVFIMLKHSPLLIEPNNMIKNTEEISRFISEKSGGKPFNFALITGQNSDHAYRYFLEIWNKKPVTIENPVADPQRSSVTEQLFIVCEDKVCQPLGHPLWEIAGFGRAEIAGEWNVVTVKVFKLVHYREGGS